MIRTIRDCADKIKSMVSMREIAEMYGFVPNRKTRKIRCPFHDDSGPSMQIYPGSRGYYCFSCNTGGDCINFVQRLFGLSFPDACRKINEDFGLHLNIEGDTDEEARKASELAYKARMKELKRQEERLKLAHTIYDAAMDRFTFLDMVMMENKPKHPDEPVSPDYIYASKNIDAAWQDVIEAADALRRAEQERR